MGVERIVVAAKIDQANRDWLEYLKAGFYPFSITTSGLINSLLTIIRLMAMTSEQRIVRQLERRLMRLNPRLRHKLMSWAYFLNLRQGRRV